MSKPVITPLHEGSTVGFTCAHKTMISCDLFILIVYFIMCYLNSVSQGGTSSRRKVTLLAVQCAEAANVQQETEKLIGRRTAAAPPPLYRSL